MTFGAEATVVATVTVVFDLADAASPEEVATALVADERVFTVRIGPSGAPSVYRVDVPADEPEEQEERALAPAERIAAALGIEITSASVLAGAHNPDAVDRVPDGPLGPPPAAR